MEAMITFDNLPQMMAVALNKLEVLGEKVDYLISPQNTCNVQWLTVSELVEYLPQHPAEQTIYGWTSARKIPFHKKGKNILFLKSEIDEWMRKTIRHKTQEEIESEAISFLERKKNK